MFEHLSKKVIKPVGAGGMVGVLTPFGPGVAATATSANSNYAVPVVYASEAINSALLVAIFTVITKNGGEGMLNSSATTSGVKLSINASGAGMGPQIGGSGTGIFNPTVQGHTYMLLCTGRTNGSNTNRYNTIGVDLTTGQIQTALATGGGATGPASDASNYGVYTYSPGTNERNWLHAAAAFYNGQLPSPYELLAAIERGNLFDFWYEPMMPSIVTQSLAVPAAPPATPRTAASLMIGV
jgi:hypothetical protein